LVDVIAFAAFGVDPAVVKAGAQIGVAGLRVGQQVPGDDQDGAADGDDGFLGTAAAGDPPVALAGEAVGVGCADGGFAQDAG
jgi:hypothetical protein